MSLFWHNVRALQPHRRVFSTTLARPARGRRSPFGLKYLPLENHVSTGNEVNPDLLKLFEDISNQREEDAEPPSASGSKDVEDWRAQEDMMETALLEGQIEGEYARDGMTPEWVPDGSLKDRQLMNSRWKTTEPRKIYVPNEPKDEIYKRDEALREAADLEGYGPEEASIVYVGQIPIRITEVQLREKFEVFGKIERIEFPDELNETKWLGYARIHYKSPSDAMRVVSHQYYETGSSRLILRSCMYGHDEKPVYIGKSGSILRVNNLPQYTSQLSVRRVFQWYTQVEYVHMPKLFGVTQPYCYVHFFDKDAASKIIEAAHEQPIKMQGQQLQLHLVDSTAEARAPSNTLHITGFPATITSEVVGGFFKDLAPVRDVILDRNIQSKLARDYIAAFVSFVTTTDAQKILDMHHLLPFQVGGQQFKMSFANNPEQPHAPMPNSTLYVGGIDKACTLEDLREVFEPYASEVEHITITRDPNTGEPKGSGFVSFVDVAAASRVLATHYLNPIRVLGRKVGLAFSKNKSELAPSSDLFVTNFGVMPRPQVLWEYFHEYKKHIDRINVLPPTKDGALFGFVRFKSTPWAIRARTRMSGRPMQDGTVPIIKYGTSPRPDGRGQKKNEKRSSSVSAGRRPFSSPPDEEEREGLASRLRRAETLNSPRKILVRLRQPDGTVR